MGNRDEGGNSHFYMLIVKCLWDSQVSCGEFGALLQIELESSAFGCLGAYVKFLMGMM